MANSARAAILDRVRAALGAASTLPAAQADWRTLPRAYKRAASSSPAETLALLTDRLLDYDAHVVQVDAAPHAIAEAIQTLLTARNLRRLIIPAGIPPEFLPQGFDFTTDTGLSATELDAFDGVLTLATVAIAETGTIVLQNVPGQGRRAATLVPDYHLCVVHAAGIVETVPEAIARLQPTAALATTFVSGPSATADIEMTRIKGVHGPRFLDVILVAAPPGTSQTG
jgi:L-lactate dehydrogenase complex protein LldG